MQGSQLIASVKNTYQQLVIFKSNNYYSTKHQGAGMGLASVNSVVKKYKGIMKISYDQSVFEVDVLLNAKKKGHI